MDLLQEEIKQMSAQIKKDEKIMTEHRLRYKNNANRIVDLR